MLAGGLPTIWRSPPHGTSGRGGQIKTRYSRCLYSGKLSDSAALSFQ